MSPKKRYLIISAGFLIFAVLIPVILLYVTGIRFDFKAKTFVRTGILAASLNPNDAKIYLNGQLKKNGSGSIKFLNPGEYQVTVKKDGYFTWNKRLIIQKSTVIWLNLQTDNLNLFFSNPSKNMLSSQVKNFEIVNNSIYYLTSDSLVVQNLYNASASQNFPLPQSVDSLQVSPDGSLITLESRSATPPALLVLSAADGKITDLSKSIGTSDLNQISFSPNNNLFIQNNNQLFELTKASTSPLSFKKDVLAFSAQDNGIYLLQTSSTSPLSANLNFEDYAQSALQNLAENIPIQSNMGIIVTPQKQIFILSGDVLYKINSSLDKLADNVSNWSLDPQNSDVIFISNGEIDYYDLKSLQINFITRTSLPIASPILNTQTGYAFFIKNKKLTALELDNRDHQNEYNLYNGQNPQKLVANPDASVLYVLDNGQLFSLKIR